jgi:zinc and cadmium transporter
MSPVVLLVAYGVLVVLASLAGGSLPSLVRLTHARMQLTLSCVGGLMLGVGLLHLIPHSVAQTGSLDLTLGWTLAGLLVMFFLIRAFHFHQHAAAETDVPQAHAHCDHDHPHAAHELSWLGVALGLAVHTLIDGVTLAAAVLADAEHHPAAYLHGLGVFLAILLHKPLDALSITSLMAAGGWSVRARQLVNLGFALMCPAGALAVALGVSRASGDAQLLLGAVLGFAGGVFLCISLSDLLPEVQFHRHDPLRLSGALLLGVGLAYAIGYLEPEHAHAPPASGAHAHPGEGGTGLHPHDHDHDHHR